MHGRRRLSYADVDTHLNQPFAGAFLHLLGQREASTGAPGQAAWERTLSEAYSPAAEAGRFLNLDAAGPGDRQALLLVSVEPLFNHAVARLMDGAAAIVRDHPAAPFDAGTVHQLFAGSLAESLQRMIVPTMVLELNLARLRGELAGTSSEQRFHDFVRDLRDHDFALRLLGRYPVLARQLVHRAGQWVESTLTFLGDLSRDWPALRMAYAPQADPDPLTGVQTQMGGRHRGGRSVLVATFGAGLRVVYKPRPLSADLHFQELLAWVNGKTEDLTLKVLTVLDRGTHGWAEFADPGQCDSARAVDRFHERQGALLALIYLLCGSDFHCENILASGEHPVLVDFEALFHPRLNWHLERAGIAAEQLADSVLRSGLLPIPARIAREGPRLDRSGVGARPSQLAPLASLQLEGAGTDEMTLARRRLMIKPSAHAPVLAGQPVVQINGDALVRGFMKVYEVLARNRDELLSAGGPVARFHGDEIRIVLRHTVTYSRLLTESFHPDVPRDGLDRDRLFDGLWGEVPGMPFLARVAAAEAVTCGTGTSRCSPAASVPGTSTPAPASAFRNSSRRTSAGSPSAVSRC